MTIQSLPHFSSISFAALLSFYFSQYDQVHQFSNGMNRTNTVAWECASCPNRQM